MVCKDLKVIYTSSVTGKTHEQVHRVWDEKLFIKSLHEQQADLKRRGKEFHFLAFHSV